MSTPLPVIQLQQRPPMTQATLLPNKTYVLALVTDALLNYRVHLVETIPSAAVTFDATQTPVSLPATSIVTPDALATAITNNPGPVGAQGASGNDGAAASVSVGTINTGNPGSSAAVVNAGTASNAVLNFTIPRGDIGATGASGTNGTNGTNGAPGPAGPSILTTATLAADAPANSTTTLASVAGLSFAVTAGVTYHYSFHLLYQSAALTTGIGLTVSYPAATIASALARIGGLAADGAASEYAGAITASDDTVTSTAVAAISTNYLAVVEGILKPSANGTLQLRFRSEVAASAVTIKQGSNGILTTL